MSRVIEDEKAKNKISSVTNWIIKHGLKIDPKFHHMLKFSVDLMSVSVAPHYRKP